MDNSAEWQHGGIAEAVIGLLWTKNMESDKQRENMKLKCRSLAQKAN